MKKPSMTPWSVSGDIDYNKLTKEFGAVLLDSSDADNSDLHHLIRRGFYYSHRDFNAWLNAAKSGKKVSILTGRGSSEKMHLGHLIPFVLSKAFQEKLNCPVYIPISDDEKFLVKPKLSLEEAQKFADDNILDIIALGFKPGKTFIFKDTSYPIYPLAIKTAKLISYSTAKAVFGLKPETNIGWTFYPAVQAAHILFPQFKSGKHHTLVPIGIDQDPYMRIARDIAQHSSLGFQKPATIHSKFLPGLRGSSKMSSSDEGQDVIYLSDSPSEVKNKINKYAFSGGKDTLEEHRKHGGNPDIDMSFQYLKYFFEEDDKKLAKIESDYRSGKMTTGELKKYAIDKINAFLKKHQENKKRAKSSLGKFMLKN
ncbi:tryptophan--tRNA ligase [Candidatus Pacearchaeota archaeon CG_4_9_14_0_2_um_filter_39_13]|nr:tryptophan--tRNA ligase [Candidatus Pacearchaeota archaeon]OIO42942.1 MAG: tryptophan--tRNA ligase [Candidatus Pacearchaeota archaeon CG1_02_39_14]PJC44992.1 MAG: tryptophan--tRNA ligase [Candidatus Pacearchaeota archaeon CG_4_9_14_0_2_um_filter_39_13]